MKPADVTAPRPRIAVVGLGQELRGDDAAGVAVAQALQAALGEDERVLVIAAGPAPENCLGPLCRFKPDRVLFVDAAQMDDTPGAIRWLPWHEVRGVGVGTHGLSPQVLARFLSGELGCEMALVGIQPVSDEIAAPLSPEVADAVDTIVLCLLRLVAQDWVLKYETTPREQLVPAQVVASHSAADRDLDPRARQTIRDWPKKQMGGVK
ncbi:MAG: hydrogenase maturation protease [Anaerolineae bacterium]|jgi:hydrogenase maturation protease HycI